MGYAVANPPFLLTQGIGGKRRLWWLDGTDATTDVDTSGYISNAKALGMKAGDIVFYLKTDASPLAIQVFIVSAITGAGAADLSAGTAVTATNSD